MRELDPAALSRRDVLGGMMGAGVTALSASMLAANRASAQVIMPTAPEPVDPKLPMPPVWETELKRITPNVYAYIQGGGPGRDNASISNCGVVIGDDGVLVYDVTVAPIQAKALLAAIRKVTDKPIKQVIYSHHHADHFGGGQYFEGAEFIAHPYCRDEIAKAAKEGPAVWARRAGWAEGNEPRKIIVPTTTIDRKVTYQYGRTAVEVYPLIPTHTYGDLVVYLPREQVMFLGDIAFFYVLPWCHNAHPTHWIQGLNDIDAMPVKTVVAGHGPLGGKAELADMRRYLELMKRETRKCYDAKMSAGAAAASIVIGKYANWIGTERMVMNTVRFYQEFAGTVTPDPDAVAIGRATVEYNAARHFTGGK